ncbi:hypothetical protein CL1_1567 [Thermococcus cleftensis]|uniref:Uncharacterized protein n=1 Tax=Thermococcus cleftensis (strain DSM 27260 / KACC 17922 / CL1) TaxID=163003 RepID=I3ZVN0_THECF|nr:hypothetical protein [Thermococcus cleftensis]AFL95764.1 hypothetical protein CL1_1567 [Thermococcus cleftensis]
MRKPLLILLTVVLMMYLYPLSIVPLLLLRREWPGFREELGRAAVAIGLSIPLYVAKVALGISGWSETLGITPLEVSPVAWWGVYLTFTALQTLAVYHIYLVSRGLGRTARIGGVLMLAAVPLHLLSLTVYFALTWLGLLLLLIGMERGGDGNDIRRAAQHS